MSCRIKHIANMRDLGGTPAADGKHVVYGRLFRGGHLSALEEEDCSRLREKLGIRVIADLRSSSELEEKPDVIPKGVDYIYIPSLTNEQNPSINRHNRTAELKRIMKKNGGAVGHLNDIYRLLITQDMARESHRTLLLKMLETSQGGVYWHCTQGKDRTGVAAAVILMALGANRDNIVAEYLNERRSLKVRNWFLTSLVGVILLNMKAKKNLSVLMNAKRPCMEAALDETIRVYGSFDRYIRDGLGLTDEQIAKLRGMYLE